MHQWCTIVAKTLAFRNDAIHVWEVILPREGYRNPYVMHGILSIAAVHKAYLIPSQRKAYLALADYHQTTGSEEFRLQLVQCSQENWRPIFGFASVVALYMMCLPTRSASLKLEDPINNFLELINVIRGIRTVLTPIFTRIYHSDYAPLVFSTRPENIENMPDR